MAEARFDDAAFAIAFANEVRRFYPFAPFVAGRAVRDLSWNGEPIPSGALGILEALAIKLARTVKLGGQRTDDRTMTDRSATTATDQVCATSPEATRILRVYFAEVASRHHGRPATAREIDEAMAEDPSTDLVPPLGDFLILRDGLRPVGCVGVRMTAPSTAELRRMFVLASERRRGLGTVLIAAAEQAALRLGAGTIRLDTRRDLHEARALYAARGFQPVLPFSDGPYAEVWLAKHLGSAGQEARRLGGSGR